MREMREVDFGEPFGRKYCMPMFIEEFRPLPELIPNSAIVLSRLGVSVQLDGNWIGATPAGERLLATIRRYRIDAQRLWVEPGFAGVREIVFSDEQSRTIFGNYVDLLYAAALAGLVCASFPGVLNSPTHAEVMQFMLWIASWLTSA